MRLFRTSLVVRFFLAGSCLLPAALPGQSNIQVKGMGFFDNLALDRRLSFLNGVSNSEEQELDLLAVEDDAFILLQMLAKRGYPEARVTGNWIQEDGRSAEETWELPFAPRVAGVEAGSRILSVAFTCQPGQLRYYETVEIRGLTAMSPAAGRDYFIPRGILLNSREDRAHTGANLATRISNLLGALKRMGYREARVVRQAVEEDPESGATRVLLVVEEGPLHRLGEVRLDDAGTLPIELELPQGEEDYPVFNSTLLQELRQSVLNQLYHAGYPDATMDIRETAVRKRSTDEVHIDLAIRAEAGNFVEFSGFSFAPEGILKESILRRQSRLEDLAVYDLIAVEEARRRLLSLGVFRRVELIENELAPDLRGVRYELEPLPARSLSLRLGYGSYEQLRAGLTWEQRNPFGRGHRYEIELRQSMKSSKIDAVYLVPHFFDQRNTGFIRAGHEAREEITYDHSTTEFMLGVTRQMKLPGAEVSLEYALEKLDTTRESTRTFASDNQSTVSSLAFAAVLDRRDSFLYPTSGFDLAFRTKVALEALGGESRFQKLEVSATYHRLLPGSVILHLGLRYGTIFSGNPASRYLPFSERFFPGGAGTVRGYQRGEASPLTPDGDLAGAESYVLGNIELEQRILKNLSLVLFWDGVGVSLEQSGWPDRELLYSVGLGLRWRSVVGPIRFEYGYNPDPRPQDPSGTFHLSVGFPF